MCNSCTHPKFPVEKYVSHIRSNPDEADKYFNLGYTYHILKKYDRAAEAFSNANKIDPNDEEAIFRYGLLKEKLNSLKEAADAFRQVYPFTNLNITHTEHGIALMYLDYIEQEQAIAEFMKAIDEGEPHPGYLYSKIGYVYNKLQMYDMAVESYKKGIKLYSNQQDTYHFYYNIGVAYYNSGDYKSAIQANKTSIKLDPDNKHNALFQIGSCYTKLGNIDEAFHYYLETVAVKPNYTEAYYNLCIILFVYKKDYKEAEKYFKVLFEQDSRLAQKLKQYLTSLSQ
ncbi:tetratricopeptide repeat protein [Candidatus Latescibacterota bacterium]